MQTDDVDEIILSSLREIGYDLKKRNANLKAYSFDETVEMVACCLKTIFPDIHFPPFPQPLPATMSARYRMSSRLAQVCMDAGLKGDIGYHTFMYQNTDIIQKVLPYLVERLPRKVAFQEAEDNETGKPLTIRQRVAEELKNIFACQKEDHPGMCSTPFLSVPIETGTLLPNQKIDCKPVEWKDFVTRELPFIHEQLPDRGFLLPSLIVCNTDGIVHPIKSKYSRFRKSSLDSSYLKDESVSEPRTSCISSPVISLSIKPCEAKLLDRVEELKITDKETEEYFLKKSEEEIAIMKLEKQLLDTQSEINDILSNVSELKKLNEKNRKEIEEKIARDTSLKQSVHLLPDPKNNMAKLEIAKEKSRMKIAKMETQWKRHKDLLDNKINVLKKLMDAKVERKNRLIERINGIRKELFEVVEQIKNRFIVEKRLNEHCKTITGAQRNEYINRILDNIKNMKKQEAAIVEILSDMRYIQKEINILSEKLERTYRLTEQLTGINSPPSEFGQETHRLLIKVHKDINDIVNMMGEIGVYTREIKDLEDQISKNSYPLKDALKQMDLDLHRLKEEQNILEKEISTYVNIKQARLTTAECYEDFSSKAAPSTATEDPCYSTNVPQNSKPPTSVFSQDNHISATEPVPEKSSPVRIQYEL